MVVFFCGGESLESEFDEGSVVVCCCVFGEEIGVRGWDEGVVEVGEDSGWGGGMVDEVDVEFVGGVFVVEGDLGGFGGYGCDLCDGGWGWIDGERWEWGWWWGWVSFWVEGRVFFC